MGICNNLQHFSNRVFGAARIERLLITKSLCDAVCAGAVVARHSLRCSLCGALFAVHSCDALFAMRSLKSVSYRASASSRGGVCETPSWRPVIQVGHTGKPSIVYCSFETMHSCERSSRCARGDALFAMRSLRCSLCDALFAMHSLRCRLGVAGFAMQSLRGILYVTGIVAKLPLLCTLCDAVFAMPSLRCTLAMKP
jgi:hypothetical protein